MSRIKEEVKSVISNKHFEIEATNRGAILRYIKMKGNFITTALDTPETKLGSKGAFFVAPLVFGRLINRELNFNNKVYQMSYPSDIDESEVDPKKIYIHGIHHWYTWEIESESKEHVSYILDTKSFPENYPFPHKCKISYQLIENSLLIEVSIFDAKVPTPAMLTMHPFFKFRLNEDDPAPSLKTKLIKKFEYDPNSEFPMNWDSPIETASIFENLSQLSEDFDHSYLANRESIIRWPNGLQLKITDETSSDTCPYSPLQIWTTGASSRNAFGIENGGPANLFWLVENKKVDPLLLPIVNPGEIKTRRSRYTAE